MTLEAVHSVPAPAVASVPRHLQVVADAAPHGHDWRLRDVEYVDGMQARRFECDGCGGVTYR